MAALEATPQAEAPASPPEVATPPVVETPPAVETPKKDKLAPRVEELRAREQSLASKESAITAKESEIAAREAALTDFKDNPLKLLETLGMTFQDMADAVIESKQTPEPLKRELKALKDELDGVKKQLSTKEEDEKKAKDEQAERAADEKIERFKVHLGKIIEEKKDTYELVYAMEGQEFVFDIIQEYFHTHGAFLPPEEALAAAESFYEKKALAASKTKKFSTPKTEPKVEEKTPNIPKTLTNDLTNGSAPPANNGGKLSEQQRFANAVKLIKFDS